MKNPLLLALFIIGLSLFIIFYMVSAWLYKKRHQVTYHFYQMFPYEFNYPSSFKENLYGNIIFVLACLSISAFYIVNPLSSLYNTLAMVFAILTTMILICLVLIPVRYLRTHIIISSLSMGLSTLLPLFNLFIALEESKQVLEGNKALYIVSMVISGLLALMMVLLILNPKLTFKIYLDKAQDSSGNEVLKRPSIIYIALNEWWAILTFILSPLALLFLFI